jgi:hypothetical protein
MLTIVVGHATAHIQKRPTLFAVRDAAATKLRTTMFFDHAVVQR